MTIEDAIATLREWDAAASPGPWKPWPHDPGIVLDADLAAVLKASMPRSLGPTNARLAALAHCVLPLVEFAVAASFLDTNTFDDEEWLIASAKRHQALALVAERVAELGLGVPRGQDAHAP